MTPIQMNAENRIRETIRTAMEGRGWSISETAREAELGRVELSLFLGGSRTLRSHKLTALLEALNIEVRPAPRRRRAPAR